MPALMLSEQTEGEALLCAQQHRYCLLLTTKKASRGCHTCVCVCGETLWKGKTNEEAVNSLIYARTLSKALDLWLTGSHGGSAAFTGVAAPCPCQPSCPRLLIPGSFCSLDPFFLTCISEDKNIYMLLGKLSNWYPSFTL